ncbi:MAG: NAD-dependent epimerase/dehydratase family protein [Gammaproteobacteria bacterium]|nr:NAD-dependent epimerase/dehydratase family protein [Gammaproteobacteria bacterium]
MMKPVHMVLAGCGYTGRALARRLQAEDVAVSALVASDASRDRLLRMGIHARCLDLDAEDVNTGDTAPVFPQRFALAYMVPPSSKTLTDKRLSRFLKHLPERVERFVYISTTGVYGDQDGQRVTENTPVAPASARAQRRVDAEHQVQRWCARHTVPWAILRTPGIYGPGRLPLDAIKARRPVITPAEASPGNRIHRDDLAMIIHQALTDVHLQGVINVGDGNHMNTSEFTLKVAELAGLAPPPCVSRARMRQLASHRRWSFLAESREVDTTRLQHLLQHPLRFADPIAGIRASLPGTPTDSEAES